MVDINRKLTIMFLAPFDNFLEEFLHKLTLKFNSMYNDDCSRMYYAHFLSMIKKHISCRFVYSHMVWCQRKGIFESDCDLCVQVIRSDILDTSERMCFTRYYYHGWSDHFEETFACTKYFSYDLNRKHEHCRYFEHVYSANQLINMFGVIACRILLNLAKKKFFIGRLHNDHFYSYFAKWTKKLFDFTCNNICSTTYVNFAILNLRPVIDYDPPYFKIVNRYHTEYLEKKNCKKCS